MEPILNVSRTHEISDPAMAPLTAWIDSYVVWTDLPPYTRASILKRASKGEQEAAEALINHNLRLVLSRAVRMLGRGVPLPDLVQEGWLGLRLAVQKYQPQRGAQFSTVAVYWIDQKLNNAIVTQGRTVYLPHHASEVLTRVSRMVRRGEELRDDDQQWLDSLARERYGNPDLAGVSFDHFDYLLRGAASIDKPIVHNAHGGAEQTRTLADVLPAPSSADPSDTLDLEALLLEMYNTKRLERRECWLIIRHFGLDGEGGRTYQEMARELAAAATAAGTPTKAVSRQRVEQLMSNAMRKVRQYVQANGYGSTDQSVSGVYSKEQTKGSQVPQSPAKVKSTESPKTKSTRRTSVNDSLKESAASRAAAPTPLRAHSSTKRADRSSQRTRKSSGEKIAATSRRVAS